MNHSLFIGSRVSSMEKLQPGLTRRCIQAAKDAGCVGVVLDFDSKSLTDWHSTKIKNYVTLFRQQMDVAHSLGLKVKILNYNLTKADYGHPVSIPLIEYNRAHTVKLGGDTYYGLMPYACYSIGVTAPGGAVITFQSARYKNKFAIPPSADTQFIHLISLDEPNWIVRGSETIRLSPAVYLPKSNLQRLNMRDSDGNEIVVLNANNGNYIGHKQLSGFCWCRAADNDPMLNWRDRHNQIAGAHEHFGSHPSYDGQKIAADELSAYGHGMNFPVLDWCNHFAETIRYAKEITGIDPVTHVDMLDNEHNARRPSRTNFQSLNCNSDYLWDDAPNMVNVRMSLAAGIWNEPKANKLQNAYEQFEHYTRIPMSETIEQARAWATVRRQLGNRWHSDLHMILSWDILGVASNSAQIRACIEPFEEN